MYRGTCESCTANVLGRNADDMYPVAAIANDDYWRLSRQVAWTCPACDTYN